MLRGDGNKMNDITLGTILALIAAITAIWAFVERIIKSVSNAIDEKLKPLQKDINLCLKAQLQLISHTIDGNHIENLKTLRDEMNQELIDRH